MALVTFPCSDGFNVYIKMFTPNLIARFYNAEKKIYK